MKNVCRTRWVERVKGLFSCTYDALDNMTMNVDRKLTAEQSGKASVRLKAISEFQFIVSLVITRCVFDITLPVTENLQAKSIDIFTTVDMIKALRQSIKTKLLNVKEDHDKWYAIALKLAKSFNIPEKKPRVFGRQIYSKNNGGCKNDTPSDFYRKTLTQPLLEYILTQIEDRFSEMSTIPYFGLSILPTNIFSVKRSMVGSTNWKDDFLAFANFYQDDLPSPKNIQGELIMWAEYWALIPDKPGSISNTLKVMPEGFLNIKKCLLILGTQPVTSCSCERSFSAMKRLKDYCRSTMGNTRLNSIALLYIQKNIVPDLDKVIDIYAEGNRRLDFNTLS